LNSQIFSQILIREPCIEWTIAEIQPPC